MGSTHLATSFFVPGKLKTSAFGNEYVNFNKRLQVKKNSASKIK